ncbi:unnamed protein product, partial [Didymodactylos carnosus]
MLCKYFTTSCTRKTLSPSPVLRRQISNDDSINNDNQTITTTVLRRQIPNTSDLSLPYKDLSEQKSVQSSLKNLLFSTPDDNEEIEGQQTRR